MKCKFCNKHTCTQLLYTSKGSQTSSRLCFCSRTSDLPDLMVFRSSSSRRVAPPRPRRCRRLSSKLHPGPGEPLQKTKAHKPSSYSPLKHTRAHGVTIYYIHVSPSLRSSVMWLLGYTYPPSTASGGGRSLAFGCSLGTTSHHGASPGWSGMVLVSLGGVGRSEAPQKRDSDVKWDQKGLHGSEALETDRSGCRTAQLGCRERGGTLSSLGSIWPHRAGRTWSPAEDRASLFTLYLLWRNDFKLSINHSVILWEVDTLLLVCTAKYSLFLFSVNNFMMLKFQVIFWH